MDEEVRKLKEKKVIAVKYRNNDLEDCREWGLLKEKGE